MKKKVVLLLMSLFISGCNFIPSSNTTSSSLSSSNEISSNEISSSASSSSISSREELDLSTINISSSNCGSYGSYTSNFGTKYISNYDFGFYRVNECLLGVILEVLLPKTKQNKNPKHIKMCHPNFPSR